MLVDTHCHLDDSAFDEDRRETIDRACQAGVELMINIGGTLHNSQQAVELADIYPGIFASVGIDPFGAREWNDDAAEISQLARRDKVVAIGESGLDYHHKDTSPERQEKVFRAMLELAAGEGLPIILHCREAYEDMLAILGERRELSGVMHCFSGGESDLEAVLGMGLSVSVGGPLTYPGSKGLREMMRSMPRERFLFETDSPYLPPQGFRGKRNEPAYLRTVAKMLAEIWSVEEERVDELTTQNARRLFGLGEAPGKIVYRTKESIYINLTNRCMSRCVFCHREDTPYINGQDLRLIREPNASEVRAALREEAAASPPNGSAGGKDEVVFCGYGEPLIRLGLVKTLAGELKEEGRRIRINTNGLAGLYHGRPVAEELKGLVDEISISLNSANPEQYHELCRPEAGERAFPALLDFIRLAVKHLPKVTLSAVTTPGVDIAACERLAKELGAGFRARPLISD